MKTGARSAPSRTILLRGSIPPGISVSPTPRLYGSSNFLERRSMLSTITKTVTRACRITLASWMIVVTYMADTTLRTISLCVRWGLVVPVSKLLQTLESASEWLVSYRSCENGLQALRQYHRAYNERTRSFRMSPVHDWSSHGADAARTMAVALEDDHRFAGGAPQRFAQMDYQILGGAVA